MNPALELTVMMYHYVHDPGQIAGVEIPGMSVSAFSTQVDELAQKYTVVAWPEVSAALQGVKPLPKSACLLTFDDGTWDHYANVFRILSERHLSGLFFVMARPQHAGLILGHKIHFLLAKLGVDGLREGIWEQLNAAQQTRFLEAEKKYQSKYPSNSLNDRIDLLKAVLQRDLSIEADPLLSGLFEHHIGIEKDVARQYYLNPKQMREMAAGGMHFGGHSQSHPWFDWIDAGQRADEIRASAESLRPLELGPWGFAYPYGGLSEDSPELLQSNGFVAAFTTRAHIQHVNPYFLGRLDGEEFSSGGPAND